MCFHNLLYVEQHLPSSVALSQYLFLSKYATQFAHIRTIWVNLIIAVFVQEMPWIILNRLLFTQAHILCDRKERTENAIMLSKIKGSSLHDVWIK